MEIVVPKDVYDGILAVRDSGKTNMLDVNTVIRLCKRMGNYSAASWIVDNRRLYAEGIFKGFRNEE